ncbi:helix-turn-helix transcriptional regulator [uncultured Mediterranea sp.]|uniref:helix-turn-helix domain-containing protein n=1 Tax=uncultured Mediterranea sp. TaxID=1926662 RepID=UPI002591243E|nr:helix-turn-helix transcriptional regulator [uncultured Mediterranea sp.]
MDEKVHLKENLAYARKLQGLRQYELAERIGVKPNTISNYEKGVSMPDFETLGKLKKVLKVSADELVFAKPELFQKHIVPGKKRLIKTHGPVLVKAVSPEKVQEIRALKVAIRTARSGKLAAVHDERLLNSIKRTWAALSKPAQVSIVKQLTGNAIKKMGKGPKTQDAFPTIVLKEISEMKLKG